MNDFRAVIENFYRSRFNADHTYTLKQFAADIGVSPQLLGQVLNGRQGLSAPTARKIAGRLQLDEQASELFVASVESNHARSAAAKSAARKLLEEKQESASYSELELKHLDLVSSWKHLATAVLFDLPNAKFDAEWVATQLPLSPSEAKAVLTELLESGLIVRDDGGHYHRQAPKQGFRYPQRSARLHQLQFDLRDFAETSMVEDDFERRSMTASVISVSESDLEFVREEIDQFRRSLISKISKREGQAELVYGLTVQFFPITRRKTQELP